MFKSKERLGVAIALGVTFATLAFTFQNCGKIGPLGSKTASSSSGISSQDSQAVLSGGSQLALSSPQEWQVHQRDAWNRARVAVNGTLPAAGDSLRVQASLGDRVVAEKSMSITAQPAGSSFSLSFSVPAGGWYVLTASELDAAGNIIAQSQIPHFGVGEVFLTAGQSNSVGSGQVGQTGSDFTVAAWYRSGSMTWVKDIDIPGASSGSIWPVFARLLAAELSVPVAVIQSGCGGTSVKQWLPEALGADAASQCSPDATAAGDLYRRLVMTMRALGSARAVLWHQGEADSALRTSLDVYRERLTWIITQFNIDSGHAQAPIPWYVANASYVPGTEVNLDTCQLTGRSVQYQSIMDPIRGAQQALWNSGVARPGPNTDWMYGSDFRYPGIQGGCIHFSDHGQQVHGQLWSDLLKSSGMYSPNLSAVLHPDVYNEAIYRSLNPDLVQAGFSGAQLQDHWIRNGIREGRSASLLFQSTAYLAQNPDVAAEFGKGNGMAAILHYVQYGISERRKASWVFFAPDYLQLNADLGQNGLTTDQQAKDHWIRYGINEGRRSSASFSPASYLHRYMDLVAAYGSTGYERAIVHYLFWGRSEGRSGAP